PDNDANLFFQYYPLYTIFEEGPLYPLFEKNLSFETSNAVDEYLSFKEEVINEPDQVVLEQII
ncbi:13081_t:CDS:2, partial [Gigaspora rosea]